jgi:hypothetical protein
MRETLDAVVTPVVREALIHDALILAGLGELPQLGDAMRAFTGQHLHAVVARALGDEMAASITEEILLTIGPASLPPSGRGTPQRPSRGPSHRSTHTPFPQSRRTPVVSGVDSKRLGLPPLPRIPTPTVSSGRRRAAPEATWPTASAHGSRPPPPEHGLPRALRDTDPAGELHGRPSQPPLSYSMPFVLVATHDASLLGTLATACGARARVCSVRTPAELVKRLDTLGGARCIVLLDGRSPSLRPAALAVLLEDAPSVDVVFANAEPTAEAFALSVSPSVRRWAVYLEPVSLDQIAAECMRRVS